MCDVCMEFDMTQKLAGVGKITTSISSTYKPLHFYTLSCLDVIFSLPENKKVYNKNIKAFNF